MKANIARVVAFATPVFAAGSAVLTPWLVKYTGLHITSDQVTALAIAGSSTALGIAWKWLDGHSKWEREYENVKAYVVKYGTPVEGAVEKVDPGIVHDIETQANEVVEAAKAKLVALIAPAPPEAAPAPVPAALPVVDSTPAAPAA